jgi:nitrite reductase/ring-hydroxylating ferredoxin subunit
MSASKLRVANTQDIKPGKTLRVEVKPRQHALVCNVNGEFYAVDDRCTHGDVSLYLGCLKGDKVHCSLHGGEFCVRTGQAVTEPAEEPLKTYTVLVEQDVIYLIL